MLLNSHGNHKAYQGREMGGGGEGDMDVGGERDYIPITMLSPPE